MSDVKNSRPAVVRGFEQAADPAAFEGLREDEFPHRKSLLVDRRTVLKGIGAAGAVASLAAAGCRFLPQRKIVPYVRQPENAVAGQTAAFASSLELGGYGIGVLVNTEDGHPTRIEGHPEHPASLGSCDSKTMAQTVSLFDPDRIRTPQFKGESDSWESVLDKFRDILAASGTGAGFYLLTDTVGSPSYRLAVQTLLKKYPGLKWRQWDAANRDQVHAGLRAVYGQDVNLHYDFSKATVVLSADSSFLTEGPGHVRYARDFMARRDHRVNAEIARLYAVESVPTNVGVVADHRARLRASAMPAFLRALAAKLGVAGVSGGKSDVDPKFFEAVAADLAKAGAGAVVVPGEFQSAECHALAALINQHLGSQVTRVGAPVLAKHDDQLADLADLVNAMNGGQVKGLLMLGGNPVYDAPVDLRFGEALAKVEQSAHLTAEFNETSKVAGWALPLSHPLESWGDTVAFDGTVAVRQPVVLPLFDSRSEIEFLDALVGTIRPGEEIVKANFAATYPAADWATFLATGIAPAAKPVAGSSAPVGQQPLKPQEPATPQPTATPVAAPTPATAGFTATPAGLGALGTSNPGTGMELVFAPDPNVHDGRFANNGWLQELPKPMSLLVWDNALYVSRKTADKLGVGQQKRIGPVPYLGKADMVRLTVDGRSLDVPVWVNLGQADDVLYLTLGGGRTVGGDVAVVGDEFRKGGGFNANVLRGSKNLWIQPQVDAKATGKGYQLVSTQYHNMLDTSRADADRGLVFETTPEELRAGKPFGKEGPEKSWVEAHVKVDANGETERKEDRPPSWYNDKEFDFSATNYQWAMTIDLALCLGCNACMTACQAENNIPVVGKWEAGKHRAMHWIRVDRYYKGDWKDGDQGLKLDQDDPPIYFQPVTCMHCENAPCEPVCPVAATTHSHEGLNQMVYNRCVGTRYCSNNCPYKVRRFNFLDYTAKVDQVPILRLLQNPEVTVRGRGVMEKCTYCVQRIANARQKAKVENRKIADGEVQTACQVACPGRAIVFGDMTTKDSAIVKSQKDPRKYLLLEELNTRPRTAYLCRVTTPNPALGGEKA